jgi:hypothetical protein
MKARQGITGGPADRSPARTAAAVALALCIAFAPSVLRAQAEIKADPSVVTNGDINGDGTFDTFDLIQLEKAIAYNLPLTTEEIETCDVDGNGKLTNYDLLVMKQAYSIASKGTPMFDAIKQSIEADLGKEGDNVEIYLDLARFYSKEGRFDRSKQVLESVIEALDIRHPLYQTISRELNMIQVQEAAKKLLEEDGSSEALYSASEDPTGKVSLRKKVIDMKNRLTDMMKDVRFAANYDSKRTREKLDGVMDDMLRKIGKDQMVDPADISKFNTQVRDVLEDPDNLMKSLSPEQHNEIIRLVDQSTGSMRDEAMKVRQKFEVRTASAESSGSRNPQLGKTARLDRRDIRGALGPQDNLRIDRLIVANNPELLPDTISIVAPAYTLKWDVTNVLGAKDVALEISKANQKFSNPRGIVQDKENALYFTPSMGGISGQRKGSALELEGVGIYQYRVAAIDTKGELISRFSDAVELKVVYNNVKIIASTPQISPRAVNPENPNYNFQWDVSQLEGAKDAAVEVSNPDADFSNPNGRERDRSNTFFFNPSLGKVTGTYGSNLDGLGGPGRYLFRVIAVSPFGDFIGQWSNPDTLNVAAGQKKADSTAVESPIIAPAPQVTFKDSLLSIAWDMKTIKGARGVSIEAARQDTAVAGGGPAAEVVVLSRAVSTTSGVLDIKTDELSEPGNYLFRVAAADSSGALLSLWSKPAGWKNTRAKKADTSAAGQNQAVSAPAQQTAQAASAPEPPPQGKSIRVENSNTPLYKDKSPSGNEVTTLKKGETLILIQRDGMWNRVYYPAKGLYGWVLSYNVKDIE